jgi:hypothetical protein
MIKANQETTLPAAEERRRIVERAGLVLAQARTLLRDLDVVEVRDFRWVSETQTANSTQMPQIEPWQFARSQTLGPDLAYRPHA